MKEVKRVWFTALKQLDDGSYIITCDGETVARSWFDSEAEAIAWFDSQR